MDYTNNIALFCTVVGLDIVVGVSLIAIIVISDVAKKWNWLSKLGMFTVAVGILGQAYYLVAGYHLNNPAHDQLWILKDVGIAIWTLSQAFAWVDDTFRKKD
jgi:hypothetical protein